MFGVSFFSRFMDIWRVFSSNGVRGRAFGGCSVQQRSSPLLSDLCSRHEKDSLVGHYRYLPLQARYLLALISGLSSNIVGSVNLSLVGLFSFGCEE